MATWRLIAHHADADAQLQAFRALGCIAIGWSGVGDLRLIGRGAAGRWPPARTSAGRWRGAPMVRRRLEPQPQVQRLTPDQALQWTGAAEPAPRLNAVVRRRRARLMPNGGCLRCLAPILQGLR